MNRKNKIVFVSIIISLLLVSCSFDTLSESTATFEPTSTPSATSTNIPTPTKTPIPTRTPNLAATQQYEDWQAEIQVFADKGYIPTSNGKIEKIRDYNESWAQINWYSTTRIGKVAENFVFSAHYKWSSASKTPNVSGCGFVFALQDDNSDYSLFVDRSEILFFRSEFQRGYIVGKTRGSTQLNLKEEPYEVDITVIVYDYYAYVLINGEVAVEYTLAKSNKLEGDLGFAILSGTNVDYGTQCEITNAWLWKPNE